MLLHFKIVKRYERGTNDTRETIKLEDRKKTEKRERQADN